MTDKAVSEKNIATSLAAAQAGMGVLQKNSKNNHFDSDYADLSVVTAVCLPPLNAEGVAVIQPLGRDEHGSYVETKLIHGATGEFLACKIYLAVDKNNMQGLGSAITYARRYGLMCMTGLAPADDDGNAAVASVATPLSAGQFQTIQGLIDETGANEDKALAYFKVESLHDLTAIDAEKYIAMLAKKKREKEAEPPKAQEEEEAASAEGQEAPTEESAEDATGQ